MPLYKKMLVSLANFFQQRAMEYVVAGQIDSQVQYTQWLQQATGIEHQGQVAYCMFDITPRLKKKLQLIMAPARFKKLRFEKDVRGQEVCLFIAEK